MIDGKYSQLPKDSIAWAVDRVGERDRDTMTRH